MALRHNRTKFDRVDLRLLDCLQRNNLQTADLLSEKVGRSPSVVARRLRRLRASGAIAADVAVVSNDAAGSPMRAIVLLQYARHTTHEIAEFRTRICASPHVQTFHELAGTFDVMLTVVTSDMDEYARFADEMLERPPVHRFETTPIKKSLKATLAVPLDRLL